MYSLDSVITVVDAKVILDRLAEEKPEGVENESVEQVCFADKILLNKTDLADETKLKKICTNYLFGNFFIDILAILPQQILT